MDNDRGDRDNRGDKDFYNDFATSPPTDDGENAVNGRRKFDKRKTEPTHEARAETACRLCLARRRKGLRSRIKAKN